MLFINVNDFYDQASSCTHLSREQELQCYREMRSGNATAKEQLMQSYLPQVAAHLKRWPAKHISLNLIYHCYQALDKSIDSFDFSQSSEKFSHRLDWHLRQVIVRHLAEHR